VDCALGMTVDMWGPESLRRNDSVLLRESNTNDRLAGLQVYDQRQLLIFGDSAYKVC